MQKSIKRQRMLASVGTGSGEGLEEIRGPELFVAAHDPVLCQAGGLASDVVRPEPGYGLE